MYSRTQRQSVYFPIARIVSAQSRLSKKPRMSRSITQSKRQHLSRATPTACNADFLGLYPYESGWNCGSTSGSRYIATTVWAIRSATVGMPSILSPPSFLGIATVRTGGGKYVPDDIRFQIL